MKKTKISKSLFKITLSLLIVLFASCGTKTVVDTENKEIEAPEVEIETEPEAEPEPEVEPEPEDPVNIAFAKNLQSELGKGNLKNAIELFETMPEELKGDEQLEMVLASIYISDGNYEKASQIAGNILETNPDNMDALELAAISSKIGGDSKNYNKITKSILEKDPNNATVNIMQAEDYALNHKYKLAKEKYSKALKSEPENADAMYGYAQMSYYMDDVVTAKAYTQKILDKEPENSEALAFMGKLAADESNYSRAVKLTKQAIDLEPGNFIYHLDIGTYYVQQGKYSDAVSSWEDALKINPDYFLTYAYLAGCYDEQKKYDEALYYYRMVIQKNPAYYYAYESAAMLEYHFGNYDEAIKYFDTAYEYSGNSYNNNKKNYCYKLLSAASYFKKGDAFNGKKVITALLKTLSRDSVEYDMVRLYGESYSRNAEAGLITKINKLDNSTSRGKMLFYLGLYYEVNGSMEAAAEYYSKVTSLQAPMFFEYRLAEWSLGL